MAKAKHKRTRIDLDIWRCSVFVQAGGELKDFKRYLDRWLKKVSPKDTYDWAGIEEETIGGGVCFNLVLPDVAIWFRDRKPPASTVAHETLHATAMILNNRGFALTDDTAAQEAYGYTQDYLVNQIAHLVW